MPNAASVKRAKSFGMAINLALAGLLSIGEAIGWQLLSRCERPRHARYAASRRERSACRSLELNVVGFVRMGEANRAISRYFDRQSEHDMV
jgi:hypothetical protein